MVWEDAVSFAGRKPTEIHPWLFTNNPDVHRSTEPISPTGFNRRSRVASGPRIYRETRRKLLVSFPYVKDINVYFYDFILW